LTADFLGYGRFFSAHTENHQKSVIFGHSAIGSGLPPYVKIFSNMFISKILGSIF
jgi:hypothetical protein